MLCHANIMTSGRRADEFLFISSEASAIPNLLVTSTIRTENANASILQTSNIARTQRTFYQDGAWVSVSESYEAVHDTNRELNDAGPQELYHKQLVERFETFRGILHAQRAQRRAETSFEASQISSATLPLNRHEWLYTIDREYPTMPQVCRLDERTVKRGLEYCAHAMDRFETISKQKSCWIWTLLALSGDIGTLDSQKMGHIRDLGNKAAGINTASRAKSAHQDENLEHHSPDAIQAVDEQDDSGETDHSLSCDINGGFCDPRTGYVRSDTTGDLGLTPGKLLGKAVPEIQDDIQHSGLATRMHDEIDTDTNADSLEKARARLLEQLGDNLVQAGIPNIDEAHARHSNQLDCGSETGQYEVKIRAMPSRAEAERQRQMMRMRQSAIISSNNRDPPCAEPNDAMHPSTDEYGSSIVDLNTRVTIDMILTIVAECYGQRDLLKFRKPW